MRDNRGAGIPKVTISDEELNNRSQEKTSLNHSSINACCAESTRGFNKYSKNVRSSVFMNTSTGILGRSCSSGIAAGSLSLICNKAR